MSELTIRAHNPQQAHADLSERLWPWIKAMTLAGHRLVVTAKQETRSLEQNAKLHAMLGEIARQVEWAGRKREAEVWKRLLTAAWLRARGEQVEILPALDGHGVDVVFRRTSSLTRSEMAELIEFVQAWAAEHDVLMLDMETGEIL